MRVPVWTAWNLRDETVYQTRVFKCREIAKRNKIKLLSILALKQQKKKNIELRYRIGIRRVFLKDGTRK